MAGTIVGAARGFSLTAVHECGVHGDNRGDGSSLSNLLMLGHHPEHLNGRGSGLRAGLVLHVAAVIVRERRVADVVVVGRSHLDTLSLAFFSTRRVQ